MLLNTVKKSMNGPVKIFFGQSKNSCEAIFFSTLYTTLPHNLIRNKPADLIERLSRGAVFFILHVNDRHALIITILKDCLPNYFLVFLSFDVYLILNWRSLVDRYSFLDVMRALVIYAFFLKV